MSFNEKLVNVLKKNEKFLDSKGELIKASVRDAAMKFDEILIGSLLEDREVKEHFFKIIKNTTIFDYREFINYIEDKNFLLDSYTRFSNKIGLTISNKHIKQIDDVVLTFPFKDCVLEGGQSKEDDNRKEIFFNETLAKDNITKLLDKKIITNVKKYYYEDEEIKETNDFTFNRDEAGMIRDNLIIKGNNLLALHTLKSNFSGTVKLIYIDPPYNTGGDSFGYNDSFNHSTWLTFMKNRLEIAKELLLDDGMICVQLDHHEFGYLNVLMDEIFGVENKVQQISVKVASPSGFKAVNPGPIDVLENILIYSKNKKAINFKKNYIVAGYHKNYNKYLDNSSDNINEWKLLPLKEKVLAENGFSDEKSMKREVGNGYKFVLQEMIADFAFKNADNVVSVRDLHKPTKQVKELQQQSKTTRDKFFVYTKQDGEKTYIINGGALAFYSSKVKEIDGKQEVVELLTNFWDHISWAGIAKEGGVTLKNGKKPEKLLKQILELNTDVGDIVLDYHLGSGTTCAVAHKMGRQYIGIEQLDYGDHDSVVRLKNVINGDQSGISKFCKWERGGEFIYLELDKYNQKFIDDLSEATEDNILDIYQNIKDKAFLNYDVDLQKIEKHFEEFQALSLEDKKEFLISMLNKNQLYKNLSEMDDEELQINDQVKALNKDFYNLTDKE